MAHAGSQQCPELRDEQDIKASLPWGRAFVRNFGGRMWTSIQSLIMSKNKTKANCYCSKITCIHYKYVIISVQFLYFP